MGCGARHSFRTGATIGQSARWLAVFACLGLLRLGAQTVWDLRANWSETSNPNGVWSYNGNGVPLSNHNSGFTGDTFTPAQPGWDSGSFLPIWFKSNSTSVSVAGWGTPDWQWGDVVTHTPSYGGYSDITWTSPFNGAVNISGAVWAVRDIGRSNDWSLYAASAFLTGGTVGSGDPYSRSTPFGLGLGSGGAAVLQNVPVSVGTVLQLRFGTGGVGDYVAVNFTITAVPEPPVFATMTAGLLGVAVWGRRRRGS